MNRRMVRSVCCTLALLALATLPAAAQERAGVGYDPQARGLSISSYQLDNLGTAYLRHSADFTARPDLVGKSPDAYNLDFSDSAVRSAFERRYGPFTASTRFKRWIGPNNEVKFLVREALAWYMQTYPELLGGDTSNRNGEPTEVEVTDVQAFGDREIWERYFKEALPGFAPERRVKICDPNKPPGEGEEIDPFWGIPSYYVNAYKPVPVSPPMPAHLVCK